MISEAVNEKISDHAIAVQSHILRPSDATYEARLAARAALVHAIEAEVAAARTIAAAAQAAAVADERSACAQVCQDHGDWCMKEAHHGGNWDYLQKRSQAVLYMAEKICARVAAPAAAEDKPT